MLEQSHQSLELLLIQNNDNEKSAAVAAELSRLDSRVRLIRQPENGIVGALNAGIRAARSPLVARMDADDIALPHRLEEQYRLLCSRPDLAGVSCLVEPIAADPLTEGTRRYLTWVNAIVTPEQIRRGLYIESPLPHPSMMIRTQALDQIGGYQLLDGPEDYDCWLRMTEANMRFAKVPITLLQWRISKTSLSRQDPRYRSDAFDKLRYEYLVRRIKEGCVAPGRLIRVWGGKKALKLAKLLQKRGIDLESIIDIAPSRIGSRRCGTLVRGIDSVGKNDHRIFYIAAVGAWNARATIRAFLLGAGKTEERDFIIM